MKHIHWARVYPSTYSEVHGLLRRQRIRLYDSSTQGRRSCLLLWWCMPRYELQGRDDYSMPMFPSQMSGLTWLIGSGLRGPRAGWIRVPVSWVWGLTRVWAYNVEFSPSVGTPKQYLYNIFYLEGLHHFTIIFYFLSPFTQSNKGSESLKKLFHFFFTFSPFLPLLSETKQSVNKIRCYLNINDVIHVLLFINHF